MPLTVKSPRKKKARSRGRRAGENFNMDFYRETIPQQRTSCMYVCTYVCMYVSIDARIYAFMYASMYL